MIKKRNSSNKKLRRKRTHSEFNENVNDVNETNDGEIIVNNNGETDEDKVNIEEIKMKQKLREKYKGLQSTRESLGIAIPQSSYLQNNLPVKNEEEEKKPSYGLLNMDDQFKGREKSEVEKKMDEYIDEQMREKGYITNMDQFQQQEIDIDDNLGTLKTDENEDDESDGRTLYEKIESLNSSILYETPTNLRAPQSLFRETPEEEVQQLTGLMEIQLPANYKLKNIAATEKARKDERQKYKKKSPHMVLKESTKNRKEETIIMDQTNTEDKAAKSSYFRYPRTYRNQHGKSTDEIAYDKFRKRYRNR